MIRGLVPQDAVVGGYGEVLTCDLGVGDGGQDGNGVGLVVMVVRGCVSSSGQRVCCCCHHPCDLNSLLEYIKHI